MPEQMHFDFKLTDDPHCAILRTNLALTEGEVEHYANLIEADEGSFTAQRLAQVVGLQALTLHPNHVLLYRDPDMAPDWDTIAAQAIAALKDAFL